MGNDIQQRVVRKSTLEYNIITESLRYFYVKTRYRVIPPIVSINTDNIDNIRYFRKISHMFCWISTYAIGHYYDHLWHYTNYGMLLYLECLDSRRMSIIMNRMNNNLILQHVLNRSLDAAHSSVGNKRRVYEPAHPLDKVLGERARLSDSKVQFMIIESLAIHIFGRVMEHRPRDLTIMWSARIIWSAGPNPHRLSSKQASISRVYWPGPFTR